jgi:hypothetical protein
LREAGSTAAVRSEGGRVEVNGLRKRMVATCSGAGDEAAVCSRARIEDDRWWRHGGF